MATLSLRRPSYCAHSIARFVIIATMSPPDFAAAPRATQSIIDSPIISSPKAQSRFATTDAPHKRQTNSCHTAPPPVFLPPRSNIANPHALQTPPINQLNQPPEHNLFISGSEDAEAMNMATGSVSVGESTSWLEAGPRNGIGEISLRTGRMVESRQSHLHSAHSERLTGGFVASVAG